MRACRTHDGHPLVRASLEEEEPSPWRRAASSEGNCSVATRLGERRGWVGGRGVGRARFEKGYKQGHDS